MHIHLVHTKAIKLLEEKETYITVNTTPIQKDNLIKGTFNDLTMKDQVTKEEE